MRNKGKKLIIIIVPLLIIIAAISYQIPIARIFSPEYPTKFDKFGILEMYPTKSGGREWFIDMDKPADDPGFDPASNITKQPDGSWQINGRFDNNTYVGEVRMEVGKLPGSEEWKNVEMTGYAKILPSNNPMIRWSGRSEEEGIIVQFPVKEQHLREESMLTELFLGQRRFGIQEDIQINELKHKLPNRLLADGLVGKL